MEKTIKRDLNGILLVNKPQGLTSNAILQRVKRLYGARKAGHTGSLDPLATGMLPICFGEATKFSQFLLDADKCYQATGCLGIKTDTSDKLGVILEEKKDFSIKMSELEVVLSDFRGEIIQTPSMFSALKHQGRPLYTYARQGIEIPRKQRQVFIHSLQLDEYDGQHFKITVVCSKGTYIRNLIEDIGDTLGVGAHMSALHRIWTAGFNDQPMFSYEMLQNMSEEARDNILLPIDKAMPADIPAIMLNDSAARSIGQGRMVDCEQCQENILFRLYNEDNSFLGIGVGVANGLLKPQRLLAVKNS